MYRANHTLLALLLLSQGACATERQAESSTGQAQGLPVTAPVAMAPQEPAPLPEAPPAPPPITAIEGSFQAVQDDLRDALSGRARFTASDEGVEVSIEVGGLPSGRKAVHIHERGDCSDLRHKSAGGHFAPEGDIHGLPDAARHHRGDLGDLEVTNEGTGRLVRLVRRVTLTRGEPNSLFERAVVIRSVREDGLGLKVGVPLACAVVSEQSTGSVSSAAHPDPRAEGSATEPPPAAPAK